MPLIFFYLFVCWLEREQPPLSSRLFGDMIGHLVIGVGAAPRYPANPDALLPCRPSYAVVFQGRLAVRVQVASEIVGGFLIAVAANASVSVDLEVIACPVPHNYGRLAAAAKTGLLLL
jgi:hypothetical protein